MESLMLYIHIPFCEQKCHYCDFLSAPSTLLQRQEYVEALCAEIALHGMDNTVYTIPSIFFGGGTPSILTIPQITQIMDTLRATFTYIEEQAEITLELNPGTVNKDKLQAYKNLGINRLSIGLQAANNEELKSLGRIHTYELFLDTYYMAREVGFANINIDLMSAIPGQSVASWEETLDRIISLAPEHISAYSLIIEEDTPFYEKYNDTSPQSKELPSEDQERKMYHRTIEELKKAGYESYEYSNYALKGLECKHNLGYWERVPYLGLGLGASSLRRTDGEVEVRRKNAHDYSTYYRRITDHQLPIIEEEIITKEASSQEYIFLGLRKTKGVDMNEFFTIYGVSLEEKYEEILPQLLQQKLVKIINNHLILTERGVDLSNVVLSKFI